MARTISNSIIAAVYHRLVWLAILIGSNAGAQSLTLAWNQNSETNLAGYKLYAGPASRAYSSSNIVAWPATTCTVSNLVVGVTNYFAVTAFTTSGLESDYSAEVSYAFKPRVPANLRIELILQSAASLEGPWTNLASIERTNGVEAGSEFFRGLVKVTP